MADKFKSVLLFGGPGSGKGTQGKILGMIPGFHHVATGDIFRSLDKSGELGKLFLSYSTKGLLVPDDVTVRIWADAMQTRIKQGVFDPQRTLLVLDGIPRTQAQAAILDEHIQVQALVHLVCRTPEAMFERMRKRALKESRPDDADANVVRRRWEVYEKETYPVLGHYAKGLASEIDSLQSVGKVLQDILAVVVPLQEKL